jgi:DNA-binding response OmpR family regulator
MQWILVADDDPVIREVWAEALDRAGYRTVQARDGREALRLIPKVLPDLMILDLRMPGLSGNEVLQQIRQKSDLSRIPVLISSGFSDEVHASGQGLNIVGRLQKPQALTAMLDAVRAALVRRPRVAPSPPRPA